MGWTASQNHLPILRPNNYSKNSGNRRAVWDVGYGGTSGYSPARVARITPETLAAVERASQKSHSNLGYTCPSSPAGVSFRDRPETVRLCVGGGKRPTRTASTTWADRAEKLCCCHSDRPNPLPLLQTTPSIPERTYKTRALISYHFTAVKLGDDAGKRRRDRNREIWSKNTPKLGSSSKCGSVLIKHFLLWAAWAHNKLHPLTLHSLLRTLYWPYGQRRFESLQTPRPWGGSDTAAPGKQANLASRPFAARRNHSELFEVSVSDKQQPQNLHER